jgi:hypothetical protein
VTSFQIPGGDETDPPCLRQQQLVLQRQENQVRVDVQNAVTAVRQTRAQYEAAVKGRNKVSAGSAYSKAKVTLDFATGQTFTNNNISLSEAFRGSVSRPPNPIPEVPPAQQR